MKSTRKSTPTHPQSDPPPAVSSAGNTPAIALPGRLPSPAEARAWLQALGLIAPAPGASHEAFRGQPPAERYDTARS